MQNHKHTHIQIKNTKKHRLFNTSIQFHNVTCNPSHIPSLQPLPNIATQIIFYPFNLTKKKNNHQRPHQQSEGQKLYINGSIYKKKNVTFTLHKFNPTAHRTSTQGIFLTLD